MPKRSDITEWMNTLLRVLRESVLTKTHAFMPTYVYRRDDGTTFETQQSITADPLDECPETGQSVERIIAGSPGIIMDGSAPDAGERREDISSTGSACSGPLCGL